MKSAKGCVLFRLILCRLGARNSGTGRSGLHQKAPFARQEAHDSAEGKQIRNNPAAALLLDELGIFGLLEGYGVNENHGQAEAESFGDRQSSRFGNKQVSFTVMMMDVFGKTEHFKTVFSPERVLFKRFQEAPVPSADDFQVQFPGKRKKKVHDLRCLVVRYGARQKENGKRGACRPGHAAGRFGNLSSDGYSRDHNPFGRDSHTGEPGYDFSAGGKITINFFRKPQVMKIIVRDDGKQRTAVLAVSFHPGGDGHGKKVSGYKGFGCGFYEIGEGLCSVQADPVDDPDDGTVTGEMSVSRYIAPQMPWECSPAIWYTSE